MNPSNTIWPYRHILFVFTPNGTNTLKKVVQMADAGRGRVTVIDVIEDLDSYEGVLPPKMIERDLEALFFEERRAIIEEQARSAGVDLGKIDIRIRFGKPAIEIIREVMASHHDLVVKTALGGTGLVERLFGTTAKKLIRKSPCPVWIARPDNSIALKRVLAAVDPMPTSRRSEDLNRQILHAAADMARVDDGHLDILHCWRLPGESTLSRGRTRMDPAELSRMREMAQKIHHLKARQLVSEMDWGPMSHELHVIQGTPTHCILDFANRQRSDLIVIGSVGLSGLSGMLMGSTAESIADRTHTSVLAVKPADYASPVTAGD